MNLEEYRTITTAMDSLNDELYNRAKAVGEIWAGVHRTPDNIKFTPDRVEFTIWYQGNGDDYYDFPAEWLFIDNWEEIVKDAVAKRKSEALAKAERDALKSKEAQEANERKAYARLKEKYG